MKRVLEISALLVFVSFFLAIVVCVIVFVAPVEKPEIEYPVSLEREELDDYGPVWCSSDVPVGATNIKSLGDHWIYFEYDGYRFILKDKLDRSVLTSYGEVE